MIQLKKLFIPVKSMEAAEAKAFITGRQEGSYTLLDVRQPGEYEEAHIPGARLLPLPQLHESYRELDPEKPTIVHCAIGGRSRVAAQMLLGLGFKEVYNLAGGIKAWQGHKATGPEALNVDLVKGDETPEEMIVLAYGMEKALQRFYDTMRQRSQDRELQELFAKLAEAEEQHRNRLFSLYGQIDPAGGDRTTFEASKVPEIMEGGFQFREFLEKNEPYLKKVPEVLELAMMVETQALDLYLRFADHSANPRTREVLFGIADDEKAHLASLGRLLAEKLGHGG